MGSVALGGWITIRLWRVFYVQDLDDEAGSLFGAVSKSFGATAMMRLLRISLLSVLVRSE
jgi:hypothetical protein